VSASANEATRGAPRALGHESRASRAHEEVRARISVGLEGELESLRRLRAAPRLLELACVMGGYALGVWLIAAGLERAGASRWLMQVAGTCAAALALNACVLLMHEGMHGVLFASRAWNRRIAALCGVPLLMSFSAYRVLHLLHHRHLGAEGDPDEYRNYTGSRARVWALQYVRLTVGCYLYLFLIPRLAWRSGTLIDRRRLVAEYLLIAAVFGALLALVPAQIVLWCWFVPVACVAFLTSARGLTQHGLTDPEDPLLASRSLYPSRIVSTLLLNENLHLEHHLFPEVPSYHLPVLSRAIDARLPRRCAGRSYLGFLLRFALQSLRFDERPVGVREEVRRAS
jgi:fatty acid desaturase